MFCGEFKTFSFKAARDVCRKLMFVNKCTLSGLDISPHVIVQSSTMYSKNKTSISSDEINKLANTGENYDISELVDNCLAKNKSKVTTIIYIIAKVTLIPV